MEYAILGGTGIEVSRLCLGSMLLGRWGTLERSESVSLVHRALDDGINFFNAADVYSDGDSEDILGEALQGRRDEVVIATKFGGQVGENRLHRGGSRRWIMQTVEASLRRLRTDYIDVYLQHRPQPGTDPDETWAALHDLVAQGKVRAIGSSTFPAEMIVKSQWTAECRHLTRPRCEEPPYNILTRGVERDVLPTCQAYGMGVLTWGPLGGGWLVRGDRPPRPDADSAPRDPAKFDLAIPENQRKQQIVARLEELAADQSIPLTHLAQAFVLEHPVVTAAIIGPSTLAELEDALAGADVRLTAEALDAIDELVPPGSNVNPRDPAYVPPGLDVRRRRRSLAQA